MRILGIDPALTITGYGLINYQKDCLSLLEAGIIKTAAKDTLPQRLARIHRGMRQLIQQTKPQVAVLEKIYAHYRHPTTAYLLGHARGVICQACAVNRIPVFEYSATRIKKAIVGRGLASKHQVQMMVASILGIRVLPKQTDVSDALALAIAHGYMVGAKLK
jgi:crossover junction endodeoxyribonuclease RuvC